MHIDVDIELKTLDGGPVVDASGPVTVRSVAVNALLANYPDEHPTGEEKLRRYQIARAVHAGGKVELRVEDVALIKLLVGKAYSPLVVGPVFEALEH